MKNAPKTHGEAYAANHNGYRDRIAQAQAATKPVHDAVAVLKADGLSGEQAWLQMFGQISATGEGA